MFWTAIPRFLRVPLLIGIVAVCAFELVKDGSEALNAPAIFGGQGEQGAAQIADLLYTFYDMFVPKGVGLGK